MGRFVEAEDRRQSFLLPQSLDDYVTEDNPVRVIEVFIDELDLGGLGFAGVHPAVTGRPAYHPSTLLKIYLYGYLNRVQSSRRLEREAGRNIELMWLTGRLTPDYKTIANFRRDKNFTVAKVAKRMEQVDASIARYLAALDHADRQDSDISEARTERITEKIAGLRRQMQALKQMEQQVQATPDKQVSLTDPDARSMATSGRGTGVVDYNVQTAVDAEHHLIVAHEVTNFGHDRTLLESMGLKAQAATGCEQITALADRGYFNGEQILACEGTGVLPCIPKTDTSTAAQRGFFTRHHFIYDAQNDHYTCPAGQKLTKGIGQSDRTDDIDHYRHLTACFTCPLRPNCTPDKLKRLKRWQHEDVLEKMQARLDRMPNAMGVRRQTVEHPQS